MASVEGGESEPEELDVPEEAGSTETEQSSESKGGRNQRNQPVVHLLPSMFVNFPATCWIEYPTFMELERQEGLELRYELTEKRLRPLWYKSDRNINCITNSFKRSGFKRLVKGHSFNFYWGHHLGEKNLRALLPQQWVNHFPGSYGIGRKDYLWKNLNRMQRQHGDAYDFAAKSYLFPRDREYFERDFEEGDVYIVKPPAQAEGRGIRLINKLEQLPKGNTQALVQRYLGEPYLINNKKFDLRIYVCVTSFDPLRAYIFEEGLARFATSDYVSEHSNRTIRDRYMHLTNYSVNKKSDQFVRNTDKEADGEGSKWSLKALYNYLSQQGENVPALQERIKDICIKTLISVEHSVVSKCNAACYKRANCCELFGFDVLLDARLKPWLIEVNVSCSLSSSSPLDKYVKTLLMADMLHMIGIVPFDRKKIAEEEEERRRSRLLRGNVSAIKHRNVFELQAMALADLPVEDLEVVMQAEDEHCRRGHWQRLIPCKAMAKYLPFFEFPRYRNTILAKWMASPDWALLVPHLNTKALLAAAATGGAAEGAEAGGVPRALRKASMLAAETPTIPRALARKLGTPAGSPQPPPRPVLGGSVRSERAGGSRAGSALRGMGPGPFGYQRALSAQMAAGCREERHSERQTAAEAAKEGGAAGAAHALVRAMGEQNNTRERARGEQTTRERARALAMHHSEASTREHLALREQMALREQFIGSANSRPYCHLPSGSRSFTPPLLAAPPSPEALSRQEVANASLMPSHLVPRVVRSKKHPSAAAEALGLVVNTRDVAAARA